MAFLNWLSTLFRTWNRTVTALTIDNCLVSPSHKGQSASSALFCESLVAFEINKLLSSFCKPLFNKCTQKVHFVLHQWLHLVEARCTSTTCVSIMPKTQHRILKNTFNWKECQAPAQHTCIYDTTSHTKNNYNVRKYVIGPLPGRCCDLHRKFVLLTVVLNTIILLPNIMSAEIWMFCLWQSNFCEV